jgi:hypothetical protein
MILFVSLSGATFRIW